MMMRLQDLQMEMTEIGREREMFVFVKSKMDKKNI